MSGRSHTYEHASGAGRTDARVCALDLHFSVPNTVRWDKGVVGMVVGGNGENKRPPDFYPFFGAMAMCRWTRGV